MSHWLLPFASFQIHYSINYPIQTEQPFCHHFIPVILLLNRYPLLDWKFSFVKTLISLPQVQPWLRTKLIMLVDQDHYIYETQNIQQENLNTSRKTCHIVVNGNSVDVDFDFGSLHCVDVDSVSNVLTC